MGEKINAYKIYVAKSQSTWNIQTQTECNSKFVLNGINVIIQDQTTGSMQGLF